MDWLKELILPSNIAVVLFLLGLFFYWTPKKRHYAWPLLLLSGSTILVFSSGPVAALLLSRLEYSYPSIQDPNRYPEADTIVVLTAYAADDQRMPLSSRINTSGTYRILEASNLYHLCQHCNVIITGYPVAARLMGTLMERMGIPKQRISIDMNSPNTEASADNLETRLKDETFFLVTSAGHMPRSMALFEERGMHPIAAPTDFKMPQEMGQAPIWPDPEHLYYSDLAVHEYMAMLWYRMRDSFKPTHVISQHSPQTPNMALLSSKL